MNSHAVDFPSIILCICHQDNRFEPNFVCNTHHWKPDTFTKKKNISRRRICFTLRRQQTYTTKAAVLAWLNTTKSLSIMNFKRLENETHHHVLKLSIELLKLGGKFLSGKADGISVNRGFKQQQHADLVHSITVHGLLKKHKVYLPRLAQSAHSRVAHPHDDGKEWIEVLKFSTAADRHTQAETKVKTNNTQLSFLYC